jgi:hypothetical protein
VDYRQDPRVTLREAELAWLAQRLQEQGLRS